LSFAGELPLTAELPLTPSGFIGFADAAKSRARYHNVSWQKHLPAV
jgi:hypothetical protein